MGLLNNLRELVALTAPSGREEDAVRFLRQRLEGLADEVTVDALGNVIARRKGTQNGARSLMISAHMDEVGFLVRRLEPTGFLRFEKLGGHDDRTLLGQRVWVRGAQGRLLGAICAKSVHLTPIPERSDR
jgi:putative aminopeptidase FrvX